MTAFRSLSIDFPCAFCLLDSKKKKKKKKNHQILKSVVHAIKVPSGEDLQISSQLKREISRQPVQKIWI